MLISQLLDHKEEEPYALQYASDTLSFAEDLPIRIFDIEAVKSMPLHFEALVQDAKYQTLYQNKGHKKSLLGDLKGLNNAKLFSAFITRHAETVERLFSQIMTQFDEHLSQNKQSLNEALQGNDLSAFESAFESSFEKKVEDIVDIFRQENMAHIGEYNKYREALKFVFPMLEHNCFKTHTSNALPLHLLFRTTPTWCWFVLIWLYKNFDKIDLKDHQSIDALGLSPWQMMFERLNEQYVIVYGPIYKQSTNITGRRSYYYQSAIQLRYTFYAFHRLFAEVSVTYQPDREVFIQALNKRTLVSDSLIRNRIKRLSNAWQLYLRIDTGALITTDGCQLLRRQDYVSLSRLCCFISEQMSSLTNAGDLVFSLGCHGTQYWCFVNIADEIERIQIIVNELPNIIKSKHVTIYQSNKTNERHLRLYDDHFIELYTTKILQIDERRRSYNSIRLLNFKNWLEVQFGKLSPDVENDYKFGSSTYALQQITAKTIAEIFRADICTIWWCDYSEQARLVISGNFCSISNLEERELKANPIRRKQLQKIMDNDHKRIVDNKQTPVTLAYQALRARSFLHIENFEDIENVYDCYDSKPRSASLVPLVFGGRILGIIEIKGMRPYQFRWNVRSVLEDLASFLSPYLYHQKLMDSLLEISNWVLKNQRFVNSRQHNNDYVDRICKILCNIFLTRETCLWLTSPDYRNSIYLAGSSNRKMFKTTTPDWDGQIKIGYKAKNSKNSLDIAFNNVLNQTTSGSSLNSNSDLTDLTIFKYTNLDEKTSSIRQDINEHHNDYRDNPKFPYRKVMAEEMGLIETMTFPLKSGIKMGGGKEIKGFIITHHSDFIGFTPFWQHTVNLVNRKLLIDLEMMHLIEEEITNQRKAIQHEIRQDINWIVQQVGKLLPRTEQIESMIEGYQLRLVNPKLADNTSHMRLIEKLIDSAKAIQTAQQNNQRSYTGLLQELRQLCGALDDNLNAKISKDKRIIKDQKLLMTQEIAERSYSLDKKLLSYELTRVNPLAAGVIFEDKDSLSYEDFVDVKLRESLNAAIAVSELAKNGIRVSNNVRDHFMVITYQPILDHIIKNLINNIEKYAHHNSQVDIVLSDHHQLVPGWTLTFSNYGDHLDESINLFAPGVRGRAAQEKNIEGDGLGLYIIKDIAKLIEVNISYQQDIISDKTALHHFILNYTGSRR